MTNNLCADSFHKTLLEKEIKTVNQENIELRRRLDSAASQATSIPVKADPEVEELRMMLKILGSNGLQSKDIVHLVEVCLYWFISSDYPLRSAKN